MTDYAAKLKPMTAAEWHEYVDHMLETDVLTMDPTELSEFMFAVVDSAFDDIEGRATPYYDKTRADVILDAVVKLDNTKFWDLVNTEPRFVYADGDNTLHGTVVDRWEAQMGVSIDETS